MGTVLFTIKVMTDLAGAPWQITRDWNGVRKIVLADDWEEMIKALQKLGGEI